MSGTQIAANAQFTFTHTAGNGSAALGAEVVAFDASRNLAFVLGATGVDVLDAATGALRLTLPRSGVTSGGSPAALGTGNSVAVSGNLLAVAYEGANRTGNGAVVIYNLGGTNAAPTATQGNFIQPAAVPGQPSTFAVPDMVTFTPDGTKLLVAIEGEPADNYAADPLGGIGIIDVATGALAIAGFAGFDAATLKAAGVRITGRANETALPGTATAAADLEPEYIAVSADGSRAFVTLQDNNALAIVNIASATVTHVLPFGLKNHNSLSNGIDPNDRNGGTRIDAWPVFGMYQPDALATFTAGGKTYVVTANEGDAREWGNFVEPIRIADATLDPIAFPTAVANILKSNANTGRLEVSRFTSDTDGDGDLDRLDVFGARSFSIWEVTAANTLVRVFDSGRMIDEIIAAVAPDPAALEGRDDNKGAEPEGITLGTVNGQLYAFVGLERANAVMSFAIDTSGAAPTASYAGLIKTPGNVAPEVLQFVGGATPRLFVANEVSATTTVYSIAPAAPAPYTLQILHGSDFEAGLAASANAPRFAAIVDHLEELVPNSITLSSGDNYIPGPFLSAGGDSAVRAALQDFYKQLLGNPALDLSGLREGAARIDIAMLNAIGIQASVFGNHEFDLGTTAVADAIDTIAAGAGAGSAAPQNAARVSNIGAQFPYLSANLDFTGTNPLGIGGSATGDAALRGLFTSTLRDASTYATTAADLSNNQNVTNEALDSQISPWTTINEGGQTIGVLGVTTQILRQISSPTNVQVLDPAGDGGVNNVAELATILQPYVDQMTAIGINKIILLSHLQQNSLEQQLAPLMTGVDIIIAGGSHAVFADSQDTLRAGDTAGNTYPVTLAGADGRPVMVVNTGSEYSYVGRLVATFDGNGVLVADPDATGPLGTGAVDPAVSGAFATTDAVVQSLWATTDPNVYFADGTRGGEVKQLADAVQGVINVKDGAVFGRTSVFLDGRRAEVRTEETNFGNLSADANLAAARVVVPTVSVSLKNGGGIRAEIGVISGQPIAVERPPIANPSAGKPEGGISQLDIENALRFNNGLSVARFTATNLAAVVENALRGVAPGATPGAFPQVGGISFSFDATRAAGDRVLTLAVLNDNGSVRDVLMKDGVVVGNPDRTFDVVMLNFLLDGGDGYMTGVSFTNRVDLFSGSGTAFATAGREQKVFADYIAANHATEVTAFNEVDTAPAADTRIQNMAARADTVLSPTSVYVSIAGVTTEVVNPVYSGPTPGLVFITAGSVFDDTIIGTNSADALFGFGGADFIEGSGGNDYLDGGEGHDVLRGGAGSELIIGGAGNDTLEGGADGDAVDILLGGVGNDTYRVRGSVGMIADVVYEGALVPGMEGGAGDFDTIVSTGQIFGDFYSVGERLVIAEEASAANPGGTYIIGGGAMAHTEIVGNSGLNFILAYGGNNTIRSGGGADIISLELYDLAETADGVNTVVMQAGTGSDYIHGFEVGVDKVDVSAFGLTPAELLARGVDTPAFTHFYLGETAGVASFVAFVGVTTSQLSAGDFIFSAPT